ncbi:hypothetical protein BH11PAT4_BH11PAT4_8790 [soil metagenome]
MADKKHFDQEFVEYLVGSIVDHSEDVKTERIVDEMGTLISLHVNAEDMSTIIGKEGRTAKALRTVLRVLGAKHNERINLKIIEPEGGKGYFPRTEDGSEPADMSGEMTQAEIHTPSAPAVAMSAPAEIPFDMGDALKDVPQDEIA